MKNGGSSDYISEEVIRNATIQDGQLCYKQQRYGTIFLLGVRSLSEKTAHQIERFVESGGTLFCIDSVPDKALGLLGNDSLVQGCIERLTTRYPQQFHFISKPDSNYIGWYGKLQEDYNLPHALNLANPDPYLMQIHYKTDDGNDVFFICNSSHERGMYPSIRLTDTLSRKQLSCWDPMTAAGTNEIPSYLPTASSYFLVTGSPKFPTTDVRKTQSTNDISKHWEITLQHKQLGTTEPLHLDSLVDIATLRPNFSGTIVYKKNIQVKRKEPLILYLTQIEGTAEIWFNGEPVSTLLFGLNDYLWEINLPYEMIRKGQNTIEIRVITTMGNYVKSLTDNPVAQYWTNKGSKTQPLKPMGMMGSVYLVR